LSTKTHLSGRLTPIKTALKLSRILLSFTLPPLVCQFSIFSKIFSIIPKYLSVSGTANFATSLYFPLSATIVLNVVDSIPCSHLTSTAHFPASKLAIIFSFVSKVGTTLGLLAFSFYYTHMGTEFLLWNPEDCCHVQKSLLLDPNLSQMTHLLWNLNMIITMFTKLITGPEPDVSIPHFHTNFIIPFTPRAP
jgi:hypothetical protein